MLLFTCVPCVFLSHFGRDLNQSGDGLPRRFQMLSYLLVGCVIGRDNYVSSSIIINYQLSWGYNFGFQLRPINGQEKRRETRGETLREVVKTIIHARDPPE